MSDLPVKRDRLYLHSAWRYQNMKNEKGAAAKRQLLLFFVRMFVVSKRKHFYCYNNIPLNQYSVNSKVKIFEVKKWDENLCIFTSKQQLTIWLSGDIIMTTAVETKGINFWKTIKNNNKKKIFLLLQKWKNGNNM